MFPGPGLTSQRKTESQMNLSRLAEIAEAVSQQHHSSNNHDSRAVSHQDKSSVTQRSTTIGGFRGPSTKIACNPFQAVSAALGKRRNTTSSSMRSMEPARKKQAQDPTTRQTVAVLSNSGTSLPVSADASTSTSVENSTDEEEENTISEADDIAAAIAADTATDPTTRNNKNNNEDEDPNGVRFREYQAEIWSEKFEDLCEFRKEYGHCHIPHTYDQNPPLAQWVKRQRYQYKLKTKDKRSTLSDERVRLLNKIGFIWNSHDVVWEERWNELLAFKKEYGHCIVPSNYDKNPQLAVWVKRQRRQFKFYQDNKPTSMTPERIAKLDRLEFAWDCRKNQGTTPAPPKASSTLRPADAVSTSLSLDTLQRRAVSVNEGSPRAQKVDISRLSGGFPLPATRHIPPSVTKIPKPSLRAKSDGKGTGMRGRGIDPLANSESQPPRKALDANSLPCEFFSFSRKFTKFPKISLPKY